MKGSTMVMVKVMAPEFVQSIDNAGSVDLALALSDYHSRLEYIVAKRGSRAVGGFFEPTKRNVMRKFVKVWSECHV